jgi:hypothetical protein
MLIGDRGFSSTLEDKLSQLLTGRLEHLAFSRSPDYADYAERFGFIAGLRAAMKLLEDTRKDLSGS